MFAHSIRLLTHVSRAFKIALAPIVLASGQYVTEAQAITGGRDVPPSAREARQAVRIERGYYRNGNNIKTGVSSCTASLIDQRILLTAGHCLPPPDMRGSVTAHFILPDGREARVAAIDWQRYSKQDLGVVLLERDPPKSAERLQLPEDGDEPDEMDKIKLLGFGYNGDHGGVGIGEGKLRAIDMKITFDPRASKHLAGNTLSWQYLASKPGVFQSSGGVLQSGGVCHGDSGGPDIVYRGNKPYIVGLVFKSLVEYKDQICEQYGALHAYIPFYAKIINEMIKEITDYKIRNIKIIVEIEKSR